MTLIYVLIVVLVVGFLVWQLATTLLMRKAKRMAVERVADRLGADVVIPTNARDALNLYRSRRRGPS